MDQGYRVTETLENDAPVIPVRMLIRLPSCAGTDLLRIK